jgi:hypothetical protein
MNGFAMSRKLFILLYLVILQTHIISCLFLTSSGLIFGLYRIYFSYVGSYKLISNRLTLDSFPGTSTVLRNECSFLLKETRVEHRS